MGVIEANVAGYKPGNEWLQFMRPKIRFIPLLLVKTTCGEQFCAQSIINHHFLP
jgi:hypothetical protein